jgi:RNA polymerase sigma-B factor
LVVRSPGTGGVPANRPAEQTSGDTKTATGRLLHAYKERGDSAARDELVQLHLPLVETLARRHARRGLEQEDLVQVGSIGLLGAIERFDPAHGTEFTAFAVPTIAGEIKRYMRDRADAVRLPRRLQEAGARLPAVRQELTARLGRPPTVRELARGLELEPSELANLVQERRDLYEAEQLADLSRPDPDERVMLMGAFSALDGQDRRLIYLRYLKGMSAAEVAKEVGLSERQLTRRMSSALSKLRGEVEGLAEPNERPDPPDKRQGRQGAASKRGEHSGRLLLRMPNSLHGELARAAEREHVSLNQFITNTLAAAMGWGQQDDALLPHDKPAQRPAPSWLRAAIVTNIVIVVVAGVLAVVLLVLAWQSGL